MSSALITRFRSLQTSRAGRRQLQKAVGMLEVLMFISATRRSFRATDALLFGTLWTSRETRLPSVSGETVRLCTIAGSSLIHQKHLTSRWSERPPVVRSRLALLAPLHFGSRSLSVAVAHLFLVRC